MPPDRTTVPGGPASQPRQVTPRATRKEPPRLAGMGIEPGILAAYRPRNGIVLICGAAGTGRAWLQAGMTRSLIEDPDFHGKIIEITASIEYEFDGIEGASSIYSPSEIGRNVRSATAAMRGLLHRSAKVIILPECRDREVTELVIEGAHTGHAVYSAVPAWSVVETMERTLGTFLEEEWTDRAASLMQSLRLIVNCTLVPSLDGKRIQLREYLAFGPAERDLFLDTSPTVWPRLTGQLLAEQGQSYATASARARAAGLISDEVARTWMKGT